MRPHVDRRDVHQGGQAHRGAHVVAEDEEGAAEGARLAVQDDAVDDRAHRVLADAEVQDAAVRVARPLVRGPLGGDEALARLDRRQVRLGEVSGSAPELGELVGERVDDLTARGAGRHGLARLERGDRHVGRQLAGLEAIEQRLALGVGLGPGVERLLPFGALGCGALGEGTGVADDVVGDLEALLGVEPEHLLRGGELVGAERGAVDLAGVLLAGSRPADDRLEDDEGGLVGLALRRLDRGVEGGHVFDVFARALPVDRLHVPAVGLVARCDILGEGDVRVVLDRDLVRVVDRDQVAELLVSGERSGLGRDALLDVAVARDDVDEVVERRGAGRRLGVEQTALVASRVGEADGGGEALAERAGRDLDALGVAVLGVSRGQRAPGAQRLQIIELETEAAEVELHVLREGGVTRRQDEAVAPEPVGVRGVVPQHALIQEVGGGGEAHGRTRVAVAHLLHRIRGQDAGGVHRAPIDLVPTKFRHSVAFLERQRLRMPLRSQEGRGSAPARV